MLFLCSQSSVFQCSMPHEASVSRLILVASTGFRKRVRLNNGTLRSCKVAHLIKASCAIGRSLRHASAKYRRTVGECDLRAPRAKAISSSSSLGGERSVEDGEGLMSLAWSISGCGQGCGCIGRAGAGLGKQGSNI